MAFGIPNSGDLTALAAQLGTIVASVGPEESAVLKGAIEQLSDHGAALMTAGISQAGSVIQADLAPVVAQIAAFNVNVATLIGLLQSIKDDGIQVSRMLFGGKKA